MSEFADHRGPAAAHLARDALVRMHYSELVHSVPAGVDGVMLARITATWLAGEGGLPERLGLPRPAFRRLQSRWLGGRDLPEQAPSGLAWLPDQAPEADDLRGLLLAERAWGGVLEEWLADMLVAACQGGRHLWEDLGVWSRAELTALLRRHFPGLVRANRRDMKWKKFLYRRLCETEGLMLCRAPTCDQCPEISDCFGPEEGGPAPPARTRGPGAADNTDNGGWDDADCGGWPL